VISSSASPAPRQWWQRLARWWAEFSLQTKLLAAATLVVSLMMTGITFFALNGIQADVRMSDTRFASGSRSSALGQRHTPGGEGE